MENEKFTLLFCALCLSKYVAETTGLNFIAHFTCVWWQQKFCLAYW